MQRRDLQLAFWLSCTWVSKVSVVLVCDLGSLSKFKVIEQLRVRSTT